MDLSQISRFNLLVRICNLHLDIWHFGCIAQEILTICHFFRIIRQFQHKFIHLFIRRIKTIRIYNPDCLKCSPCTILHNRRNIFRKLRFNLILFRTFTGIALIWLITINIESLKSYNYLFHIRLLHHIIWHDRFFFLFRRCVC